MSICSAKTKTDEKSVIDKKPVERKKENSVCEETKEAFGEKKITATKTQQPKSNLRK